MRNFTYLTLLVLLALGSAAAQNGGQELPSAPSASVAPKPQPPQPKPAPAAQPATSTPAQPPSTTPPPQQAAGSPKTSQPAPVAGSKETGKGANSPLGGDDDQPITTIRKRVDEVNVVFTVTDKHGRFVKNLTKTDFSVLDDNKAPVQVLSFSKETDLPLRVGLLVDASNSIRTRFRFEQDAATEFLTQIVRPRYDLAFVLGFDTTAEVVQDFTDDGGRLSRGVHMLRPGGGTALFDAVYYACRDKLMKAPQTGPVRRAIILLSDGEDNQSRVTREEAIEMAQRAEVIVYAISTNDTGTKTRGDKVLERLSDATGGRAFFPLKVQEISNAFSEIQDELRSQYAIAYKPADFVPDGHFRTIQILAQNHKSLQVRARRGYFSPRQ